MGSPCSISTTWISSNNSYAYDASGGCLTGLCGVGGEPYAGSGSYWADGICCNAAAISEGCTKAGPGGYRISLHTT
jgi:hypothetical protein